MIPLQGMCFVLKIMNLYFDLDAFSAIWLQSLLWSLSLPQQHVGVDFSSLFL